MCNFCVSHVCKTREFGIDDDLEQEFTDIKKYQTENSFWFITIDKQIVRVRTDDLFEYNRFAKAVFDQINVVLPEMSKKDWKQRLKIIGASAQIEEMGDDATLDGRFDQHLHAFVNDQGKGLTLDECNYGKAFEENGKIYFKMEFLLAYLEKQRFRGFDAVRVAARLKEKDAESVVRKVEKKNTRLWEIGDETFKRIDALPLPKEENLDQEESLPF
jgi:RNA binding exosome subunit